MSSTPLAPVLGAFIFDLDGVIWRGQTPIEGASASVERLREAGKRLFFATNNSSRPPAFFAERLRAQGIKAQPEDVITSSTATSLYLRREVQAGRLPSGFCAYIVGEEGIVDAVQAAGGYALTAREAESHPGVDVVVVGIDRDFTYHKLKLAQKFILAGAPFVATNRDSTFPVEGGVVPGAGSIVASVETATSVVPPSMGKPEPLMVQLVLENFGLSAAGTAMVGDRLDTDIACAHRAGIVAVHVNTGVTPTLVARAAEGELRPHLFFEDLPHMCAAVLEAR